MSWVDLIKEFEPFNEKERRDTERALKYTNMSDDILIRDNGQNCIKKEIRREERNNGNG